MALRAKEDQFIENNKPLLRKVLTSKVKYTQSNFEYSPNNRAKTSKEMSHLLNPDYEYNMDKEAYLEEKEIQEQVRLMINEAKRVRI